MLILALDTTTRAGSLAIVQNGTVLVETTGDPALTHGQRLPADFQRISDEVGVPLAEIDLFAVAAGPGSFTGLRVGIAAIQGLAFAFQRQVVPVSTLDAIAARPQATGARVASWMDAQRHEVFASIPGDRRHLGHAGRHPGVVAVGHRSARHRIPRRRRRSLRRPDLQGDGKYVRVATTVPLLAGVQGFMAAHALTRGLATRDQSDLRAAPDAEPPVTADQLRMTGSAALTVERLTQPDAEDFNAIVALEGESFSNPWTAVALADMLTSPVTRLYVARQPDRRVIGFCACWLIEDELHINTVAVQPTVRRRGGYAAPEGDSGGDGRAAGHPRSEAVECRGAETL